MDMRPTSSLSSVNSFAQQANADSPEAAAAKQAFRICLARYNQLNTKQQECLLAIADAIFDGDLTALQKAITILGQQPRPDELVSYLAKELRCPGIVILPLQFAKWRFEPHEESKQICIFSIQLIKAHRILALANDGRFRAHVYGTDRDLITSINQEMNEDPRILLKQIGRIFGFGKVAAPPPFYSGPRL